MVNIDQYKILFPLTPNVIGFLNKNFPPWRHGHLTRRYQQKVHMVIFKSGHVLEQYPKNKILG